MLNIKSILSFIQKGVMNQDPRFQIMDHEHIYDTKTGIKLHLYSDGFKISHNSKLVATDKDFAPEESEVIWNIRNLIVDPALDAKMAKEYPIKLQERRKYFSSLFENPEPPPNKNPLIEENTVEYTG